MNVNTTRTQTQQLGSNARRTVNKGVKTVATAAHVGVAAVFGFLKGFATGSAPEMASKPRRK